MATTFQASLFGPAGTTPAPVAATDPAIIPATRYPGRWTPNEWSGLTDGQRRHILEAVPAGSKARFNDQGDKEGIEWSTWSWNPVTGCEHGCGYCYARDIALSQQQRANYPAGFLPVLIPERLHIPRRMRVPADAAANPARANVFVCSMSDLFGKWVPQDWIDAVLAEIETAQAWRFLTLTKFPQRLAAQQWPANVWAGASVDRQPRAAVAERAFRDVRAGIRWLSCEPLLEPLRFADLSVFDWLVIGGQSATNQPSGRVPASYPEPAWVDDLIAQAKAAGCAVFVKSNTAPRRNPAWPRELPRRGWAVQS